MAQRKKGLLQTFKLYIFVPAFIVALVLTITIVMMLLYVNTGLVAFVIVLGVFAGLSLVAYIIYYLRLSKKLKSTYYQQLYETTLTNINKIKNNDVNLVSYGNSDIREIQLLDKATSDIKTKFESSYLVLKTTSYENINLEYVDKELSLITYKSFKENIANIIFVSQSFRNVIIDVFFDMPGDSTISQKDKDRLLALYRDTFKEHENVTPFNKFTVKGISFEKPYFFFNSQM